MAHRLAYDAVVVGSGPNGLAAAIVFAAAGRSVLVMEEQPTTGGGARSAELTLPGFVHDLGSAVHPMAVATSFLSSLPLEQHGLRWIEPAAEMAHPFDDAPPAMLHRSIEATRATLGGDGAAYDKLIRPIVDRWDAVADDALAPVHIPTHPLVLGKFGLVAMQPAAWLIKRHFDGEPARGFFAGLCTHTLLPFSRAATASIGIVLAAAAHRTGWPIPAGGSQSITNALAGHLRSLGGEIVTSAPVRTLSDVPTARNVMFDVSPRALLEIAGDRFSSSYRDALSRFQYGPGVCKMDWALSEPVPWRDPACALAGTVHLGGAYDEIAASEAAAWRGDHSEKPFVLLSQPSLFDPSRAPAGKHVLWGYCHVPNNSTVDMTERIESQIERFAPGFRDCILERKVQTASELHLANANLVGGDIGGGANTLKQIFFRPTFRRVPYATPVKGLYLCSASTPPGAGVHGLCGAYAARAALKGE